MSRPIVTLQSTCQTIATLYNASLAITDQLLWLDEEYFQPFVKWATPRLQDAAVSVLVWTVISIIRFCQWLVDTIERCAATNTQAIATLAWAQAHAPGTLALAPITIPVVVCPENRWQCWITHQLPQALLLPSATLAIAGQDNSATTELEQSLATSAQTKQIALLPPAKASNRSRKSSTPNHKRTHSRKAQTQSTSR
jgi:phosphoribosylcarboxyaminoimidazole (NCAIR) mutase